MLLGLIGCAPLASGPIDVTLEVLDGPVPEIGPVRRLRVEASRATRLLVEVAGADDVRELLRPEASLHELSLVGLLPETTYDVVVTALDAEGGASASFTTEGPPAGFPRLDVLAHEAARLEPGLLLFAARPQDREGAVVMALDEQLRLRWWYDAATNWSDVRVSPRGNLVALVSGKLVERRWDGELVRMHTPAPNPDDPAQRPLDCGFVHHEIYPLADDSFWTLSSVGVEFDAYPRSYGDLEPVGPAVLVEDTPVVRVGPDGRVLSEWSLADRLDRGRISWDGLWIDDEGRYDWAHGNAVVPDGEGGVVVSVRNQDAIVRLDADGALDWILGDPAGWDPGFADHLLVPEGDLAWPYHQHAPEWHPDERLLVVFDNVDRGHTPYTPDPGDGLTSRVVAYEVDGRAVRQRWELTETATGPLRSKALGDADLQPRTGNVLATYGFVQEEGAVTNEDAGRGHYTARLIEWDRATPDAPVLDLRVWGPLEEGPGGWQVYRAEKVPPPW